MTRAYGNLINRIQEEMQGPAPEVGMGATETMWSDRHAGTITRIISPTRIGWKRDKATGTGDGMSTPRTYTYERDPRAPEEVFSLRRSERWVRLGESMGCGAGLIIGMRNERWDPGF